MSQPIRVGLAGVSASGMPKRFAKCIGSEMEEMWLSAAWDEDSAKRETFCKEYDIEEQRDPIEMAKQCDLVIMDVQSRDTSEIAPAILDAGTPLYISKPIADNLSNALCIIEAARKTNTPLLATSTMRYESGVREAARILQEGELGDLHILNLWFHHSTDAYLADPREYWHCSLAGGGPMWYLGVHVIDILEELWGLDHVVSVLDSSSTMHHQDHPLFQAEKELRDTHAIQLRDARGVVASIVCGFGVDHYHYGGIIIGRKAQHAFTAANDYRSTLVRLIEMVRTGCSPLSLNRMENVARILDTILTSSREQRLIELSEKNHE
ncbi:MAG: Gfo/Idh/MocA family oxidoreductase [Phycisphaerae bacterium]|nr:Gfo/Idh/MocA family oxidoreductase [Phycisphaerae bacterium]